MAASAEVKFTGVDAGLNAEIDNVEKKLNSIGGGGGAGAGGLAAGFAGGVGFSLVSGALDSFANSLSQAASRNEEFSKVSAEAEKVIEEAFDGILTALEPLLEQVQGPLLRALEGFGEALIGVTGIFTTLLDNPVVKFLLTSPAPATAGKTLAELDEERALAPNPESQRLADSMDRASAFLKLAESRIGSPLLADASFGAGRFDADFTVRPTQGPTMQGAADPLLEFADEFFGGFAKFGDALATNVANFEEASVRFESRIMDIGDIFNINLRQAVSEGDKPPTRTGQTKVIKTLENIVKVVKEIPGTTFQ